MKKTLKEQISTCTSCELHEGCEAPVPYVGKPGPIMILGEAPGRTEDEQGRPFVGPAGHLLFRELKRLGISRRDCFIANAVCCYPHGTPTESQIYACRGHLYNQLKRCNPSFVLALGNTIKSSLWGDLGPDRGNWAPLPFPGQVDAQVLSTWHPAYILRNRTRLRPWREDLATFAEEALA